MIIGIKEEAIANQSTISFLLKTKNRATGCCNPVGFS
jgi:hypothetical protein